MIETLAYLCCVLCFVAYSYKLVESRRTQPLRGLWYLSGFGICIASGIVVLTPAVESLVGGVEPWVNLVNLAGDMLKVGAITFAVAFARSMQQGENVRRGWLPFAVMAVVMVLESVLFFAARPYREGDHVVPGPGGVPLYIAYCAVFWLYDMVMLTLFIRVFARFARFAEAGLLRTGLWMIVSGVSVGLVWAFWNIDDIYRLLHQGKVEAGEDNVSAVLAALCVGQVVAGATLSLWGPRLAAPARSWRAYRRYRRIEPLWTALCSAVPGIALYPGRHLPGGAEFVLYRRVIEIRDGQLALRPYFDPQLPERAEAEARRSGVPEPQIPATVEAASIAAALVASKAGRCYRAEGTSPPAAYFRDGDVEAEATWLVEVTRAWRTSPVVEVIRSQAREDVASTV
ncbi:MAB_1171c family putative transporter [Amycolatopsis sp. H20-H5]|uniref:MAB_1171c family putative transporter n=1 Tax=Amycolatopsis sp. H20-H5 TaxID=3046309 RepID=UPI002DB63C6A|nr:MAB_1171c family putative transporter [Amycolatopsis sp. H20-H5]MEC3973704.1 MAB_1171c family putative transporter [Amycolatopsis sp. H20-H5]